MALSCYGALVDREDAMRTRMNKIKPVHTEPSHKPKYQIGDQVVEFTPGGKRFYLVEAIDILYSAVDVISNYYYYSTLDLHTGSRMNRIAETFDSNSKEATLADA